MGFYPTGASKAGAIFASKTGLYGRGNALTVISISPPSGPEAGGTVCTITGTNFVTGAVVTFGGIDATGVTVTNSTHITCTSPMYWWWGGGLVDITVTNPDTQSGTLAHGYTYVLPPAITSFTPNIGADDATTAVTIHGVNFVNGCTVKFGTLGGTSVIFVNSTELTCLAPSHGLGYPNAPPTTTGVAVTVINPDSQQSVSSDLFYYPYTCANPVPSRGGAECQRQDNGSGGLVYYHDWSEGMTALIGWDASQSYPGGRRICKFIQPPSTALVHAEIRVYKEAVGGSPILQAFLVADSAYNTPGIYTDFSTFLGTYLGTLTPMGYNNVVLGVTPLNALAGRTCILVVDAYERTGQGPSYNAYWYSAPNDIVLKFWY